MHQYGSLMQRTNMVHAKTPLDQKSGRESPATYRLKAEYEARPKTDASALAQKLH